LFVRQPRQTAAASMPANSALSAVEKRAGHVCFSSKNPTPILCQSATPELPLLEEAASELAGCDDLQLLPSAAIDCEQPWGNEWTPATTLPASRDGSAADEADSQSDREDPVTDGVNFCLPSTPCILPQASPKFFSPEQMEISGSYFPMWCLMEQVAGVTRVTPVSDGNIGEPPSQDGIFTNLWCWSEMRPDGVTMIVPCTDKGVAEPVEQTDLSWMPPPLSLTDAAVVECAPAVPTETAYVPEWVSGPVWPFNSEPTTLMLTNLPSALNQEDLLEVLDREEFNGYYDFVYFPEAGETEDGGRYAVVNLIGHVFGKTLAARLHGKTSWGVKSDVGPCEVKWALPYQGLADLVRFYRDALEIDLGLPAHVRPQIFSRGWQVNLPEVAQSVAKW